jgi:hypothetical protein
MAPGIDEPAASALSEAWGRLGGDSVSVILDTDPEVVRLGYGTLEGLEMIQRTAIEMDQAVCHQPGVRICVVLADEISMIFSPTPLLIEAGSSQPERPNGLMLSGVPSKLNDELGLGEGGVSNRKIGLEVVTPQRIEAVKSDIKENPPLKFDITRKERVFNAKLEFVEFELEGCFISRHTITIPPELVGMAKMDPKTRDKLRSSFRLIEKSDTLDAKKGVSEKSLSDERNRLGKKYLVPIKGYGTVILRSNKEAFEEEVKSLREKVVKFRELLRTKLSGIYGENAKRLTTALLPAVAKNPPENWTGVLGSTPDRASIKTQLYQTLLKSFGEPEALLREMKVNVVFKGVTYGTLTSEDFVRATSNSFPSLKLVDEFDASRGRETSGSTQPNLF